MRLYRRGQFTDQITVGMIGLDKWIRMFARPEQEAIMVFGCEHDITRPHLLEQGGHIIGVPAFHRLFEVRSKIGIIELGPVLFRVILARWAVFDLV